MPSQVIYRKWRPQTFTEVVGQKQVTQTLLNAVSSDRLSHAYLFCGPRGTGKTSTGRILAKAVNCLNTGQGEPCNQCNLCQSITEGRSTDVIEIDAASNRRIDEIRELRERVNYVPNQARYKVYIIDEVHMLTTEAANALLKTLEEPPQHVIFVLATTEAHKILPTIMSRCQRFDFHRISQKDIVAKLGDICQQEDIHINTESLRLITRGAQGSLRDAENILEQLATCYGNDIKFDQVQTTLGISQDWRSRELMKHIINNDLTAAMTTLSNVHNDGLALGPFQQELVEYLRGLLLIKTGSAKVLDFSPEDMSELKALAEKASLSQILQAIKLFCQPDLHSDSYSTLPLELALVDYFLNIQDSQGTTGEEYEAEKAKPETTRRVEPALPDKAKIKVPRLNSAPPEPAKVTSANIAAEESPHPEKAGASKAKSAGHAATEQTEKAPAEPAAAGAIRSQDTPGSATPESALEKLVANWRQVIAQAPPDTLKTTAVAILRSAGVRPVAFEDDTVVLAFKYPLHQEKISQPENQKVAENIIGNFLGRPCHVRCIYQPEDNHMVLAAQKLGAQIISTEEK